MPTVFFQEPKETKLEAAQRKVAELEAELGPDHLDLVKPLNSAMMIYYEQVRYGKAEEVCRRVLEIREKFLGPDHPDVAKSLNNLAGRLRAQGSYAEAGPLYERALDGLLNHLSPNMGSMTEAERFQYLAVQTGSEPLLLNLVAMQGNGPTKE